MSSKSKSSLSDTTGNKAIPATPRVSKLGRAPSKSDADTPSPPNIPRASIERSPRSVTSKSNIARPSPRTATPPEKLQSRILKPSELQAQLLAAQDELKKAKEKLIYIEKEKALAHGELEEARKSASEANEKLQESLAAQKRAEESSEIEKFRAVELEQAGIEAVRKKEEEWQKELQEVRNQHAIDMASLLSASTELQRVKQELAMVTDTKNQALIHADEATKIAEIHADKAEKLSAELVRLKGLFESNVKSEATESQTVMELNSELDSLKLELERGKGLEKNLSEKEEACEHLKVELASVREELEKGKFLEEEYEQLKLELESFKQQVEKAKCLEEDLCQKEESLKQLKSVIESLEQELEKAKCLEEKVSLKEELYEQLKSESDILKQELEKARGFEEKLAQKDEHFEKLHSELESLKQELGEAKGLEQELFERDESCQQLKLQLGLLERELEKAKGFEKNLAETEVSYQQMKSEFETVKQELEKAKGFEEKLSQIEELYEQLDVELEASRMAESYARNLLDEWKSKFEVLELQVEESSRLERCASESLESVMKQLEGNSDMLHDAECELSTLKEKLSLMEISLGRQKGDLEKARNEASVAVKEVELLKSELESVTEEKNQALDNEKLAASSVQDLLEEKNKLINELDALREDEEKSKKAMESLASALHEISAEAREAKEKLLSSQAEHEGFENQIEDLKLILRATSEKYESLLDDAKRETNQLTVAMDDSKLDFENQIEDMRMVLNATSEKYETLLNDAKREIDQLTTTVEHLRADHQNSKSEWDQKEIQLVNCIKTAEEEKLASTADNQKLKTSFDDAIHNIDYLKNLVEQSKVELENSKAEWQRKEVELLSSVQRSEEEKMSHKATDEKYGTMLDDAKDEIKHLSNMIEKSKMEFENSHVEWENRELQLMNSVKRSEEEKSSMEKEIMRLVNLLRDMEEKSNSAKEEGEQLRNTLKEAISEATCLKEALDEAKSEDMKIKTNLQDKETQLKNLTQENEQLRVSAYSNARKVEELSKLLEEDTTARKQAKENGDLSDSERDYDLLPRVVEFSEENGQSEHSEKEAYCSVKEEGVQKSDDLDRILSRGTEDSKDKGEGSIADSEPKMWESCKIDERDFSTDREGEHESVDDDLDSKAEAGESLDQSESGRTSPSKQHKKKKPLYRKFGNLLKKGIGNQK